MTKKMARLVLYKMQDEGMDYCFRFYSNWDEVKDDIFHSKRLAFLKAGEELEKYILESSK